jgi:glycosyltransferase involved in cell wall biosynthesis
MIRRVMKRLRIGFVLEQELGHVAYGMSLRRALELRSDIEPVWLEVSLSNDGLGRLPLLGSSHAFRGNFRARRAIARAHRQKRLDALFVHTEAISLFTGDYMTSIPTMLSLDATPINYDTLGRWYRHQVGAAPVERAKFLVHRSVMRRARHITTWSEWAKRSLVDDYGLRADTVTVVHPGTPLDKYAQPRSRRRPGSVRRPRGTGPMRILFVGGDFERKGGDVLLRVFREHFRSRAELHVVTWSVLPDEDGVHFYRGLKPHSPELLRLYAEADVFVLPTRADCSPVVLGEAMAAGLPIVSTRVAAIPEAVHDGESGFLIDCDDEAALRDRLERLMRDPTLRARMGKSSRRIGEARFDMDKNANRIADLLLEMADRG